MTDHSKNGLSLEVVQQISEFVLRGLVEDGTIDIQDKSPVEIIAEFRRVVDDAAKGTGPELTSVIDYREGLLDRAKSEADAGNDWIAVTLYAIWIEHAINATLTRAFERKEYDPTVATALIRELSLRTKASALWVVAELPPIKEDDQALLDQIIQFRNSFVHYKWIAYDEPIGSQRSRQLADIVKRSPGLVTSLVRIEAEAFWGNRDAEVIGYLRESVEQRWQEKGPFNVAVPPEIVDE